MWSLIKNKKRRKQIKGQKNVREEWQGVVEIWEEI